MGIRCRTGLGRNGEFGIRGRRGQFALSLESRSQGDDDIVASPMGTRLYGVCGWFGQKLQTGNMDRPERMPFSARVGVNQRRKQLQQRKETDEGDAEGWLHEGSVGFLKPPALRQREASIRSEGASVKPANSIPNR